MPCQQLIDYHTDIGPPVDVVDARLCSMGDIASGCSAYGAEQIAHWRFQLVFRLSVNRLCEVFVNRFGVTPDDVGYGAHC